MIAYGVAGAAGLLALICLLYSRSQVKQIKALRTDVEALTQRIHAQEQMLATVARSYRMVTQTKLDDQPKSDENTYFRAMDMIRRGTDAETLAKSLGLPQEEAELMVKLHAQSA